MKMTWICFLFALSLSLSPVRPDALLSVSSHSGTAPVGDAFGALEPNANVKRVRFVAFSVTFKEGGIWNTCVFVSESVYMSVCECVIMCVCRRKDEGVKR